MVSLIAGYASVSLLLTLLEGVEGYRRIDDGRRRYFSKKIMENCGISLCVSLLLSFLVYGVL